MRPIDGSPVQILLVEDSEADVLLTQEALAEAHIANELHVTRDGEQGMAFMRRRGAFADVPRPDLVLLDLNMPRMDGHQVLRELKSDPELRDIPVVMLTTSAAEDDVAQAYHLLVNAYVRKPVGYGEFMRVVRSIESFWLSIVELPDGHRPA